MTEDHTAALFILIGMFWTLQLVTLWVLFDIREELREINGSKSSR